MFYPYTSVFDLEVLFIFYLIYILPVLHVFNTILFENEFQIPQILMDTFESMKVV
jgi:hypothetical protein